MTRKRRGRGEGGIFQRADGIWVATLSYGADGKGKRKRKTVYARTKAAAIAKLWEMREAPEQLPDAKRMTVGAYLRAWLDTARTTVRATTWDRYSLLVAKQILPHLDGVKILSLTGLHVDRFYAALRQAGESGWTVFHAAAVLTTAFKAAVRKGILQANPCDQATRPKMPKSQPRFWGADEVKRFLAAARGDRLFAFFSLSVNTGARSGELLGLHWPDVNFDEGSIVITHTLEEVRGKFSLREPKTEKSRRKIDLPAGAVDALLEHRKAMLAEGRDVKAGPVFCDNKGGFIRRSNLHRRHFYPLLTAAGVPEIRVHDLRHSHASLMMAMGVNPKVVQERLGHSRIETTLGTYSHVSPGLQKQAARQLDQLLG
jgi:integrase